MSGIIEQFMLMMSQSTGFSLITGGMVIMWAVCAVLFYLAIVKEFEPLLLLPITFGALLANIPTQGVLNEPFVDGLIHVPGGLYYYISQGIHLELFPPIIFLGVGALTDFGPLIANPRTLLLGAAAQLGIFVTMFVAVLSGMFTPGEGASIGIIGGADGPTAIFTATKLAPELLGPIAVAAYSYMALVPLIQPPIMRLLTTEKERQIVMTNLRPVSKRERIIFPIVVTILCNLIVPPTSSLIGMLMFGNLIRECGVLERLSKTAQNELANLVTILLGISIGSTMVANNFLRWDTALIMGLGLFAFVFDTAGGVLFAKFLNLFRKNKINPMIGAAGISAFPMSGRIVHKMGLKEDPQNFLLMHSIGVNVSGQIASVIAGGLILNFFLH